ncbi:MAG: sodium:calcium antiporter [Candidatus Niyogibacteria bacterium]|nr:sodium:calcium antiporter [Candidatus Niyogibacteria bacterium]
MNFAWLFLMFAASLLLLVRSSSLLVRSMTGIARLLGMSEYMVSFILMSFATSISELFVGISSAVNGTNILSLGNVLGANLVNLTLVVGISSMVSGGIEMESKVSRGNFWLIFILSLFPLFLGADGVISRADGLVLLASFFVYIWHVLGEKEYFSKVLNHKRQGLESVKGAVKDLAWFFGATAILLLSSSALVWSGIRMADWISFGLFSFGVVFIALGTTLPELAFGIRAALSQNGSMAVGNSLGSVAFNSAFIVGVVSLIRPIAISGLSQFLFVSLAFVGAFILFNLFVFRRSDVSRREGAILISLYLAFLAIELWFKNG